MSIPPIGAMPSVSAASFAQPTQAVRPSVGGEADFGTSLGSAIDGLQSMQSTASELAIKAVTGDLADVHDYTIAATQASVAMELTATIRNRAVDAFNEIMRMQG